MGSVRWLVPLVLAAALGGCGKPATPEDPGEPCRHLGAHRPLRTDHHLPRRRRLRLPLHGDFAHALGTGQRGRDQAFLGRRRRALELLVDGWLRVDNGKGETCVSPG